MSKVLYAVSLVIATAIIVGGVVYWLKPSTDVNVSVTIEQMRNIAELATTEWTMSAFVEREFQSQGLKKFRSDFVVSRCSGTVRGRVNLEVAEIVTRETADGREVSIHFPAGSLTVSGVEFDPNDPDAFQTISCAERLPSALGQPARTHQVEVLRKEGMKQIREKAIEKGIVEKTKQNAVTVLETFVGSLGHKATITFDENAYDPQLSADLAALPAKAK
jgi:hypothetical protein